MQIVLHKCLISIRIKNFELILLLNTENNDLDYLAIKNNKKTLNYAKLF